MKAGHFPARPHLARRRRTSVLALVVSIASVLTVGLVGAPAGASATRPHVLVVPTRYHSIQAAVVAAQAGDEVLVLPGVYREQVAIDKNLTLTGSGTRITTIRAPQPMVTGEDGGRSIIEIRGKATVAISNLTVSGPSAGNCSSGPIESGINVLDGGHLDLDFARVTDVHDTPIARCGHNGVGVLVGNLSEPGSGSVVVRDSIVSDYTTKGILVLSAGPTTVTRNAVIGPNQVSADGIDVLFANATITGNLVTNNQCRSSDPSCGSDFFNLFQHIGIFAGGPNTLVRRNVLQGNQVGIFGIDSGRYDNNVLLRNGLFGLAFADGSFTATGDVIIGPGGGTAVVAQATDTNATLTHVQTIGTTGAPVQTFECCGFAATAR